MRLKPLLGAMRLAVGRGDGIREFGTTPQAFLASFAPWIALPIVFAVLLAMARHPLAGLALLLVLLVGQLAQPVISHAVARRMGREAEWLRYATAFNWSQWAVPMVAIGAQIGLQIVVGNGVGVEDATVLWVGCILAYGFWLHWTVARHGLGLGLGRALLFVVLVEAGRVALISVPHMLRWATG